MRQPYNDALNNALLKMFNTNRDYISQEINRLASVQQRETEYRRNGILDFGAIQMINLTGEDNFTIVGVSMNSPIVGK